MCSVNINFVTTDGEERRVPGRVGQSLFDVSKMHKLGLDGGDTINSIRQVQHTDDWVEDIFGEGINFEKSNDRLTKIQTQYIFD